jgi:hypothetical protein
MVIGGMVFAGLTSNTALAQNTVGQVLDAGGKKLSKEELVDAIVDGNVSGPTVGGGQIQVNYKADGTFVGSLPSGGISGSWTVDDSGKLCLAISGYGRPQFQDCGFYFRQADQYYWVTGTDDRGSLLLPRTIKK